MKIDELRIKLMEKATFVCWPNWSGGNALGRIISAHQEDYWWHPWFNLWKYDEKITCPLQYPETQDYQETLDGQFWTTAHLPSPFTYLCGVPTPVIDRWHTAEEINQTILNFFKNGNPEVSESFLKEVVNGNKRFVWLLGHVSATYILERYPNIQQIVELNDADNMITTRMGVSSEKVVHVQLFKEKKDLSNKKVLYLHSDKFFGEDFSEYETEFDKLFSYLKFTYPRKKAVRAYILYYNDRKKLYGYIDKQSDHLKKHREKIEKRKNENIL